MPAFLANRLAVDSPRVLAQYQAARIIVERAWFLNDLNQTAPVNRLCHLLAYLVHAHVANLTLVSGFVNGCECTWLKTVERRYIIDPYPVGILSGPLLVDIGPSSPWHETYDASRTPLEIQRPHFERDVADFLAWYANAGTVISFH